MATAPPHADRTASEARRPEAGSRAVGVSRAERGNDGSPKGARRRRRLDAKHDSATGHTYGRGRPFSISSCNDFWLSTKPEMPHNPDIVLFVRTIAKWRTSNDWQQGSYRRKRSHSELRQRSVAQFQSQSGIQKTIQRVCRCSRRQHDRPSKRRLLSLEEKWSNQ